MLNSKKCFTLAEVLITLAIIGVVAALTIPTLITKMSQKAAEARTKTIEARLLDGINRYSTLEDGLSQSYETTYDFLVGLSKHYKMAQICKADEITNCVPYSTINYTQDGEDKSIEVSTLTSIGSFISGDAADDYLAPASFITGQGTPVVMAFKKDCVWDTGKAMRDITDSGCIAYMYDENGTRNPNKIGKDWVGHGLTVVIDDLGGGIAKINGVILLDKFFLPKDALSDDYSCSYESQKVGTDNYGITMCNNGMPDNVDYWGQAMYKCHNIGGHLPDETESLAIIKGLFKDNNGNSPSDNEWDSSIYKLDTELANSIGLKYAEEEKAEPSPIWLKTQISSGNSSLRAFSRIKTYVGSAGRYDSKPQTVCIK